MKIFKVIVTGILILLIAGIVVGQTPQVEKIEFETVDGLKQVAWFHPTNSDQSAPLLVLMHMRANNHDSFRFFIEMLQLYVQNDSTGTLKLPNILNCDLRGHGQSTRLKENKIDYQSMSQDHYRAIPYDISQLVKKLIADKKNLIDTTEIVTIGASIGANAAIMFTEYLPRTKKVIMLSPGENYHGMEPSDAIKKFTGRSLIFTGIEDRFSRISSEKLVKLAGDKCELKIFDGAFHGTDIINNNSVAMKRLMKFLFRE